MNNAQVNELQADEWGYRFEVTLNGTRYGIYKTREQAQEIAESFKGTLAN